MGNLFLARFFIATLKQTFRQASQTVANKAALEAAIKKIIKETLEVNSSIPNPEKILKDIKRVANKASGSEEIKRLANIFKTLDQDPQKLLEKLVKKPQLINEIFNKLDHNKLHQLSRDLDFVEPPDDGSQTALMGVSSSWIMAVRYAKHTKGHYKYWFTTKKTGKEYGPDIIRKAVLEKMLMATGTHGSGAGQVMWDQVPYWIAKHKGHHKAYPTGVRALSGLK